MYWPWFWGKASVLPRWVSRADWLLIGGALLAGGVATGASIALGSYRLLFG